ncbi:MAG: nucleotidyltransferase domain-containing protein [Bacteroidetes bacterium]|nr:nucleotidyltransferase domain-containing protein [Bacteroidota bacterium]
MSEINSRYDLQKYINEGCLYPPDKFLFLFSPRFVFEKNAKIIQSYFQKEKTERGNPMGSLEISVDAYQGKNEHVSRMESFLQSNAGDFIAGVYIHGSIGTGDEIQYSDFDALVILKNEIFSDRFKLAQAACMLSKARRFMLEMDPLQHHGWFVMTEKDFNDYPETYFPSELFRHAKSVLPDRGAELNFKIREKQDYLSPCLNLCAAIEKKLVRKNYPSDVYGLKNLLSEFMLLPALYFQAKYKRGIYKKDSFAESQKDFTNEEWQVMDVVSSLRENWVTEIPGWKRRWIASSRFYPFRLARWLSGSIPSPIHEKLTDGFYLSMLNFIRHTREKLK